MEFIPDLLDDFISRKVAIFLGAGVSAGVQTRNGDKIKTWKKFLEETSKLTKDTEIIAEVAELIDKEDYLFACEILRDSLKDNWENILKTEYEKIGEPTALQKAILRLKQRVIVTTNFDLFIESCWDNINTNATHHLQVRNGISADCFSLFRDEQNYLIKIHGSINAPETMIFSLGDYASKAHTNWQYNTFMETLLNTFTVLFIGFSMNDSTVTNLLEVYAKKYPKSRPHYAFLPDYTSQRKINIMKAHRRLFVIPYSSKDDHKELTELLKSLSSKIDKRKKLVDGDNISQTIAS